MQVKKFTGENTAQVMALIRKEFGDEAIILQTNRVKTGGFLGFFQKEAIEILAALDNEVKMNKKNTYPKTLNSGSNIFSNDSEFGNINNFRDISKVDFKSHIENMNDIKEKRQENFIEKNFVSPRIKPQIEIKSDISKETIEVKEDIDEIKNTVLQLSKKINDTFKTPEEEEEYKKEKEAIDKLINVGLSYQFSKEIVTNLKKSGKIISYNNLKSEIIDILSDNKKPSYDDIKHIVFVGPTGVGKTTTLAKIASKKAIEERKKIGFLTLDTYRISAVEQLKTYAEILSSPIEVAYEIQDLKTAIERLSNRDVVFIDTAGRSHNNKGQVEDLKNVLDNIYNKKIYIVISANINLSDIHDIIDIYNFIEDYDIIVTKMDETKRYGNLLDIMNKTKKNIAYTAFGQNVPDDIEIFNLETYVSELIGEIYK